MRHAALLLCLLACEHDPTSAPPAEPACFADSLPPLRIHWEDRSECTVENLACRDQCLAGDADACFSRGLALQRAPTTEKDSTELFRRACQLGLATGCTNLGADVWFDDKDTPECLYRLFKKTCGVGDHFGCGMAGRVLVTDHPGLLALAHGRLELELSCARLGGFPCRMLASFIEKGTFAADETARIPALMARACSTGDEDACGDHATAEETFH